MHTSVATLLTRQDCRYSSYLAFYGFFSVSFFIFLCLGLGLGLGLCLCKWVGS